MLGLLTGKAKVLSDEDKDNRVKDLLHRLQGGPTESLLLAGGEPLFTALDDRRYLERWLGAEKWNVASAKKRLEGHARWRAAFTPAGRVLEAEVPNELAHNKCFVQGNDVKGRPVGVLLGCRHSKTHRNLDETKRFICYCLDAVSWRPDLSKNPAGLLTFIFDLRDMQMDAMDAGALLAVFEILERHYPETLGILFMYEAPSLFWVLWRVVGPFVDPVTKAKIKFIYEKDGLEDFLTTFPAEVLPERLGGQAKLIPVEDAVKQLVGTTSAHNKSKAFVDNDHMVSNIGLVDEQFEKLAVT